MLVKQNQLRFWTVITALFTAVLLVLGACDNETGGGTNGGDTDIAVTLTPGGAQSVGYTATGATVSFTGNNIPDNLTAADFAISPTGAGVEIASVTVNEGKTSVTIAVTFPANSTASAVVYTVTVAPGNKKIKADAGVTITQAAPPVMVNALDLSDLFDAPVANAEPDEDFDSTQYSGEIVWTTTDNNPVGDVFDYSTAYKAVITLTANAGFTLNGLSNGEGVFTYTDAVSVTYDNVAGKVTVVFIETDAPPPPHIIHGSLIGEWMTIVGQKVPVSILAGKTYELGISYKGEMTFSTNTWTGYGLYINIGVFDGVNSTISASDRYFSPEGSINWSEESYTFSYDNTEDDCMFFIAQGPESSENIISIREIFMYNITDDPERTTNLLIDGKFRNADNITKYTGAISGNDFILAMRAKGTGWVLYDTWDFTLAE